jgi:deoxyribonuclease V
LADLVVEQPLPIEPRLIAGLDASFSADGVWCLGAVVVWDRLTRQVVEQRVAAKRARFPYIPGLLSFREAPALLAALRRLRIQPELLMCDGQGRAHPRRFGLACHLGVLTDLPVMGCAKSVLFGAGESPGKARGAVADLRFERELLGRAVRTRCQVRPVYVSVGHRVTLEDAVRWTLACAVGYRLPEPTRLADALAGQARTDWMRHPVGGVAGR